MKNTAKNDQELGQLEDELRKALANLSTAELRTLLDSTQSLDEVMELASSSKPLSENLSRLLAEDFERMPERVKNRLDSIREKTRIVNAPALVIADAGKGLRLGGNAEVPFDIQAAAEIVRLPIRKFKDRLLGFSMPTEFVAAASSRTVTLVASLDLFRGGTVLLELQAAGRGIVRSRFTHPKRILLYVYAPAEKCLVPLQTETDERHDYLVIESGDSAIPVSMEPRTDRQSLCLLVMISNGDGQ